MDLNKIRYDLSRLTVDFATTGGKPEDLHEFMRYMGASRGQAEIILPAFLTKQFVPRLRDFFAEADKGFERSLDQNEKSALRTAHSEIMRDFKAAGGTTEELNILAARVFYGDFDYSRRPAEQPQRLTVTLHK